MGFTVMAALSAIGVFAGMLILFEVGRRVGRARLARDPEGAGKGAGPVEAGVFGLLGLLLAFSFSGAASRFEDRRHLVTAESNAIGTAYLRVDLVPADAQPVIRELFRRYLEARIEAYRNTADIAAHEARLAEADALQGEIWSAAMSAVRRPDATNYAPMLLFPALNEMIDITTTRRVASQNHPPTVIFVGLAGLCLVSALLVGYVTSASGTRNWFYVLLFAATMSLTFYLIIDLEYPRLGLIRVNAADQTLVALRELMR